MSSLVDHLVELTRFRDRDQADALLMETLADLIRPLALALHRCVGEPPQARWLSRPWQGRTARHQGARRPDFEQLPPLDSRAEWLACVRSGQPQTLAGEPVRELFPVAAGAQPGAAGVLELQVAQPLSTESRDTVQAIVKLYGNFLALLDYGQRDALTGLLNRKTFDDAFMNTLMGPEAQAMAQDTRASRSDCRHWLAVLDVDHFKRINDRFGHLLGDEVLLLLARLMRSVLRFDDQIFRFGGEEFVVLLSAAQESDVAAVLERLRAQVEQFDFPQVGRVTVSLGFSDVRAGDLPTAAFDRADKALYLAKTSGRNRVSGPTALAAAGIAEPEVKSGGVDLF
ncbi:GGDEF domain-containing protein [Azohydromonas lata]|uniref:GGDEF domain-containing protein n=1 Tax=Azohydromonas lata TaxID=45677 RepID=UPI000829CA1F|nr:GGDEF domain-containing protein [Azohydromonas lata]